MIGNDSGIGSWKLSRVSPNRRYHEIDGKPLYKKRFDEVMSFHEPGIAPVRQDNHWFHISPDGSKIYDHVFDKAWGYYEGLASVILDGEAFHINENGSPAYGNRFAWCGNYQEGLCTVRDFEGFYYHIDHHGKAVYSAMYCYAGDYHEGFAAVQTETGLYTHINLKGVPLYNARYLDLGVFHKGAALARDEVGWFHIDTEGSPLYYQRYESAEPFYNGLSRVSTRDGSIVVINLKGEIVKAVREHKQNLLMTMSHDLVGYWKSFLLMAAIDFGIFESIPASTIDISSKTGMSEISVSLLLNALKERRYLEETDGLWHIAGRFGDVFKTDRDSLSTVKLHWLSQVISAWEHIDDSLKGKETGFRAANGVEWFSWLNERPEEMRVYHDAMIEYAMHDYAEVPELIDFSPFRRIIGLGVGSEFLMKEIMKDDYGQEAVLLSPVPVSKPIKGKLKLNTKIRVLTKDILLDWGTRADAVVFAKVLQDWEDRSALRILLNANKALPHGGTLFIIENVLSQPGSSGSMLSLHLYLLSRGRLRTLDEFLSLLSNSGFAMDRELHLFSGYHILICRKTGEISGWK